MTLAKMKIWKSKLLKLHLQGSACTTGWAGRLNSSNVQGIRDCCDDFRTPAGRSVFRLETVFFVLINCPLTFFMGCAVGDFSF